MKKPNAELYNGDHQRFAELVDATGMSKRAVARALGIGYSTLRCYLDGTRTLTYVVQYAVEQLANSESKIKLTGATKMKLFNVASGIIDSGFTAETLESTDFVINYAQSCDIEINADIAASVVRVATKWIDERENGNGEWSRMADDAERKLVCYMHAESGDVATAEMWKSDFDNMDVESWFGLPADECAELHWLDDSKSLIEVEWDSELENWT